MAERQQRIGLFGKFTPDGIDQTAGARFSAIANVGEQVSGIASNLLHKEAAKVGAQEGAQAVEEGKTQDMGSDFTTRGQARIAAAQTAYKARVRRDATEHLNELMQSHGDDSLTFANKADSYIKATLENVDPRLSSTVKDDLLNMVSRSKITVSNNEFKKTQQQALGLLVEEEQNLFDEISNAARAGDEEGVDSAFRMMSEIYQRGIDSNLIDDKEVSKRIESLKEKVVVESWLGDAERIASSSGAASDKIAGLDNLLNDLKKEGEQDLNSDQNRALESSIERIKNSVIRQEQSERTASKAALSSEIKETKEQVKDAVSALNDGINVSNESLDSIVTKSLELNKKAGESVIDIDDLTKTMKRAEGVAILAKQPLQVQEELLARLSAIEQEKGLTPEQAKDYAAAQKAHEKVKREASKDALTLYTKQGFAKMPPLRIADEEGNFSPEAFVDSLSSRRKVASEAAEHYGVPASPLTDSEASKITAIVQDLDHESQGVFLSSMVEGLGDDSISVMEKISKNGGTVLAWAGGVKNSGGDPSHILRGSQLVKENKLLVPTGKDFESYALEQIGSAYQNQSAAMAAIAAAKNAYASLAQNAGEFSQILDDELADKALAIATGGVVEYGDTKVPAPIYGMDQDEFDDLVDEFKPHYLDRFGTDTLAPGISKEKVAEMIQDEELILIERGAGKYLLKAGSNFIQNNKGEPYVLNMKAIIE